MQEFFENLSAQSFEKRIAADRHAVVLDVRTPSEVRKGHIPNALNIDINALDFDEKTDKLDPEKSYYIYCRSGKRSVLACLKMHDKGFEKIHNLNGGILAWRGDLIT